MWLEMEWGGLEVGGWEDERVKERCVIGTIEGKLGNTPHQKQVARTVTHSL